MSVSLEENTTMFAYFSTLPKEVLEFCPHTTLCPINGNESSSKDLNNICCIPCDCSEICSIAGTCCADVNTTRGQGLKPLYKPQDLKEKCVQTFAGRASVQLGVKDLNTYMLVQSCPEEEQLSDDIKKCLRPDENILNEVLPVYSKISARNYRNIFCAVCNNDTNGTVPWESHVMCYSLEKAMTLLPNAGDNKDFLKMMRSNDECLLQFKPSNLKAKYCVEENEILSDCSEQALYYTPELRNLCLQPHSYSPVIGEMGIYKNVFCMKCNDIAARSSCKNAGLNTGLNRFATILRPETYVDVPGPSSDTKSGTCQTGLTYDNNLKTCLQKSCAISEMKVGQRCLEVMQRVQGVSLEVRLKLLFPFDTFLLTSNSDLLASLHPVIISNEDELICAENVLGVRKQGDRMAVRIQMIKVNSKRNHDLKAEFEMLQGKIRIHNKKQAMGYSQYGVELDVAPFKPIHAEYVNLAVYAATVLSVACGESIALSKMQFCETTVVKRYKVLKGGIVVANNASFYPGEYIIQTSNHNEKPAILICYKLYVSRTLPNVTSDVPETEFINTVARAFIFSLISLFTSTTGICM